MSDSITKKFLADMLVILTEIGNCSVPLDKDGKPWPSEMTFTESRDKEFKIWLKKRLDAKTIKSMFKVGTTKKQAEDWIYFNYSPKTKTTSC